VDDEAFARETEHDQVAVRVGIEAEQAWNDAEQVGAAGSAHRGLRPVWNGLGHGELSAWARSRR
jgi:hypothetical protein